MGFFSIIGECICSVASAIGDAISSVCSALGSEVLSTIGCVAAALLIPGVGLPELLLLIKSIADVIMTVVKLLGLNEGNDSAEELGMKAEIADRKPEDFDSIEEYIKYLNDEVELDEKKVENLTDEEKVKYGAMGVAIGIKGIEEKYDISISPEFAREVANMKLSGEEVKTYIDEFKNNGINNMQDMTDYLKGNETVNEKKVVSGSIIDAMNKLYPELNESEIESKLSEMKTEMGEA